MRDLSDLVRIIPGGKPSEEVDVYIYGTLRPQGNFFHMNDFILIMVTHNSKNGCCHAFGVR